MNNMKDAKEVKKQVEAVIKKRTTSTESKGSKESKESIKSTEKCTKNRKSVQKKSKNALKNQKTVQKLSKLEQEKKKKLKRFLVKLLIFEYITISFILLFAFNYKNIRSLEHLEGVNKQQELTIATLVNMLNSQNDVKVEEKQIKYTEYSAKNKGTFKVTAYCSCAKCCGKWATLNGGGFTASGTKVEEGRTIAVYKNQIPFGTKVHIEGMGTYIAEDTGSAIKENCIDIYFDSHEEALNFGVKYLNVEW